MSLSLKPRIGAQDFVYSLLTESSDVVGGTPSYGTIYSMPGTVKIGVKVNGKAETLFADDVARLIAETIGKIEIAIDMADILPADLARLLGHSYANGVMGATGVDQSPYVAVGFKLLRTGFDNSGSAPAYDYFWFYKGKFAKFDIDAATKADSIKWSNQSLVGQFSALIANNYYKGQLRTDDPAVTTAAQAAFFTQVTMPTADTTALTAVIAAGGTAKTVTLTFSKASNSGAIAFSIPAATLTAIQTMVQMIKIVAGTTLCTFTAAITSAGTGFSNSPVVVTLTISAGATSADNVSVVIPPNSGIIDNNGTQVTAVGKAPILLA